MRVRGYEGMRGGGVEGLMRGLVVNKTRDIQNGRYYRTAVEV